MKTSSFRRLVRVCASLVIVASSLQLTVTSSRAAVCGDVHVVWARGSGQPFGGPDFTSFYTRDLVPRLGTEAVVSAYELGRDGGFGGFAFPASGDLVTLIDAQWWLPGNPYDNSVEQGRQELIAYVTDRAAQCPNEAIVLGGYSQGAQVIGEGLSFFDVSPNGSRFVVAEARLDEDPGPHSIYVMNVDGTDKRRVADGEFPAWAPLPRD